MVNNRCCRRNFTPVCGYVIAFGLGMSVSCFCPYGLMMFIAAIIITALGIIVIRK